MEGRTTCAVPECGAPISGDGNLCDEHHVPGGVVRVGDSTMVITAWYAEHEDECGIVLLNDSTLGARFSGAEGFLAKLQEQGFVNVRLLLTPEELVAAKTPAEGKRVAAWSGSWHAQYPWQEGAHEKGRPFSDLRAVVLTNVADQAGNPLMVLVYGDGTIRLKYPHGTAANIDLEDRVKEPLTVDDQIEVAEKSMRAYCSTVTRETPQFTVHRMPGAWTTKLRADGSKACQESRWLSIVSRCKVSADRTHRMERRDDGRNVNDAPGWSANHGDIPWLQRMKNKILSLVWSNSNEK